MLLGCLSIACTPTTKGNASNSANDFPLQTVQPMPSGVISTCAEQLDPAVLRGNPADSRLTWLQTLDGRRVEIIWPLGFVARFEPTLEVIDPSGKAVLLEGDFVEGACEIGDPGGRLMNPPFLALKLDCGPLAIDDCTAGRLKLVVNANGWPNREIASVKFLDANGRYLIRFEDGTERQGTSTNRQ